MHFNNYQNLLVYYIWSMCVLIITDIKLKKWDSAIADCNAVLRAESQNLKGITNFRIISLMFSVDG